MFDLSIHMLNLHKLRTACGSLLSLLLFATSVNGAPLDQPPPEALIEGKRIVQEMRTNPRGPFSRIRWYCNDGTVQPPVPYICSERGGGRQHGEYSDNRQKLAGLGWSVGTVYAALTFEELFDSQPRQGRLRELPLERYLIDIDNGWILHKARNYRGSRQIEDEVVAGRTLLQKLLADSDWASSNFLLVREAARTIAHGKETDLARSVRRLAIELAELEPAAESWRAEIHSNAGIDLLSRLRAWTSAQQRQDVVQIATRLGDEFERLYGSTGIESRVSEALKALRGSESGQAWARDITVAMAQPDQQQITALCSALAVARGSVFHSLAPTERLALVDAMQELETNVQLAFQRLPPTRLSSRAQVLQLSSTLVDCAYGSGLLSLTEKQSLLDGLSFATQKTATFGQYRKGVARLKRAPAWAMGTIRYTFAEALVRYTALDSRAARFSDDLLRGSPLWMLGDTLKTLAQDVDSLAGSVVEIAGQPVSTAVALNTGIARGTLRVFETIEDVEHATLLKTDVVALPETIAELSPVAGILTLGEGNALSHVQLLARNFGIPNVAVDYETVERLKPLAGREVLLVVSSTGSVVLRAVDETVLAAITDPTAEKFKDSDKIVVPVPKLDIANVLSLGEIGRALSGKVVGPKAANLGELNRLFPGRVAPAVALPFGAYAKHIKAAGLDLRIASAFANRANDTLTIEAFDAELASIRVAISTLVLGKEVRSQLLATMKDDFGAPGSYGVFVRSDTNVEDLPQFTGAGLNETIPNVVGLDAQLAAVPRVWSSILSPRALAWRSSVLENPAQIYASVLLMKSVPVTKSGVLVTSNLFDRSLPGLTASAAWGVGGAVAGEAAESIVIFDQQVELITEAKSPYRRRLAERGGVDWVPAEAGVVLQPAEIGQLRALAAEVNRKYEPVMDEAGSKRPWDIEFGFIDGELTLFQIRPLVEKASRNADALLHRLRPQSAQITGDATPVALQRVPGDVIAH